MHASLRLALPLAAVAAAVFAAGALIGPPAHADRDEQIPLATDPVVQKECGACHVAYAPRYLPARSWQALMTGLDSHFGENAALDAETAKKITDYLVANSADSGGRGKTLRGVAANAVPLRISELPWFVREHREIPAAGWADPKVKSKSNCLACHNGGTAGAGWFGGDDD